MTTYGYCLPYPTGSRLSVWFTGGCIEVGCDIDRWRQVFDKKTLPGRTLGQKGKLFVAKLLMGAEACDDMDENGKISYQLKRPLSANIDLAYIDGLARIMRGKSGAVYVFRRVQDAEEMSSDEDENYPLAQRWGDSVPVSKRPFLTRALSATRVPKRDWGDRATVTKREVPSRNPSGMRVPSRSCTPPLDNDEDDTPSMRPMPPTRSSSPAVDGDNDTASLCPTRSCSPAADDDTAPLCPRPPTRSSSPAVDDHGAASWSPKAPTRSSSPSAEDDDDDNTSLCPRMPTRSCSPEAEDDDDTSLCPRMPTRSCSPETEDDDDTTSLSPRLPTRSYSPAAEDDDEDDDTSLCPRMPTRSCSPAVEDGDTASLCPRQPKVSFSPSVEGHDDTSSLCPRMPTRSCSLEVDNDDDRTSLCPKPPTRSSSPAVEGDDDTSSLCPRPPTRRQSPEAEEDGEGSQAGESELRSRVDSTSCGLVKASRRHKRRSSRKVSDAPIAHTRSTHSQHREDAFSGGLRRPTRSCSPTAASDDAPDSGVVRPIARRCNSYAPLAPRQPRGGQRPSGAGTSSSAPRRPTRSCSPTNGPVSDNRLSATRRSCSSASLAPQRPMRSRSPSSAESGSPLCPKRPIRSSSPTAVDAAREASLRNTRNSSNGLAQVPPPKTPARGKSPKTTACVGANDRRPRKPRRSITIPSRGEDDDIPEDVTDLSKPCQSVPFTITCDHSLPSRPIRCESLDFSEGSNFMGESSRRLLASTAA